MASRTQRRKRVQETPQQFTSRLATLRLMLNDDPAMAGDQAVKLLEEYLESLALREGYRGEGSLGRYAMFLRGRNIVPVELLDRADSYTQVRNALAHTYGLQTSPALAEELVVFLETLFKQHGTTVADLMTRDVHVVAAAERLDKARDLMVRGGYGRLPVIDDDGRVIGLLTERDIVIGLGEGTNRGLQNLTVRDTHLRDADERVVFLHPNASRDEAAAALREPHVVAVLVTPNGTPNQRPIGIITAADLLYRV